MDIKSFPEGFMWGTATSSFQVEGAWNEGGKSESIWDRFCSIPGRILNRDTPAVSCDYYHSYEKDINLLEQIGVNTYRFSISWPRVMPEGTGALNPEGIQFYKNVIQYVKSKGIQPVIMLYMWDLPQKLQNIGGWVNPQISDYFADYAGAMFREFGSDVSIWMTVNEPHIISHLGHARGVFAPGLRDFKASLEVSHQLLLAHGKAVRRFRELEVVGEIGIGLNFDMALAASGKPEDAEAADRWNEFQRSWYFDPLLKGHYPEKLIVWFEQRGLMPEILQGDMDVIQTPFDFISLNYYKMIFIRHNGNNWPLETEEVDVKGLIPFDGIGSGQAYPQGLYDYIMWVHNKYGPIKLLIGENGIPVNDVVCYDGGVHDQSRIDYLYRHLEMVHKAIQDGANVRGYMVWSLLDNFELTFGYFLRFGLVFVDLETQKRTFKDSAYWYGEVVSQNGLSPYRPWP
ncbi:MAG: beta-galactosidase [Paenibacillaceae bacterium]|jgi:beta-glucosidase|nr:beta-galactosidase [Paenibacillaceae bacterium]